MERFTAEKTGHLIASYRARFASISLDQFAHLWVDDEIESLHAEILTHISNCEDLAHALRSRFFIQRTQRFFDAHPDGVFVNLAAGLSHYPLFLSKPVICIEVERPDVIDLKRKAFARWTDSGDIPSRAIEFITCDLDDSSAVSELANDLHRRLDSRPTYLLMEGLLFYLQRAAIDTIFDQIARRLPMGSRVGSVSFETWTTSTRPYQRLIEFFDRALHPQDAVYSVIDDDFYAALPGLRLIEKTNCAQMIGEEASLGLQREDIDEMLIESLYVLERI